MSASDLTELRRNRSENYLYSQRIASNIARRNRTNEILKTVRVDEYDEPIENTWFRVSLSCVPESCSTISGISSAPVFFGTPAMSGPTIDKHISRVRYHANTKLYVGTFAISAGPEGISGISFSQ